MTSACVIAELSFDRFFRGLTEGIQGQRGEWSAAGITLCVLTILALAAGVAGLYYALVVRRKQRTLSTPTALFEQLCQAHRLSPAEVALLNELLRQDRVALAPRIFLEPERFEIGRRTGSLAQRGTEITALRSKIFAGAE